MRSCALAQGRSGGARAKGSARGLDHEAAAPLWGALRHAMKRRAAASGTQSKGALGEFRG